jgi:hypothetical protein
MGKKYLIDEVILKDLNLKGLRFDTKEVEVLDINAVIVESATEGVRLHEYIKANNLLIVKIIE